MKTRVMYRTKAALIKEIRQDKRIEEVLKQNFQATDSDLCNRCTV